MTEPAPQVRHRLTPKQYEDKKRVEKEENRKRNRVQQLEALKAGLRPLHGIKELRS